MGLNDDEIDHLPIMGGTRSGKITAQSLLAQIARDRGHKVVEILADGTRTSLDPVLPGTRDPWVPWLALRRNDVIFSGAQECGMRTIDLPKPYVVPKTGCDIVSAYPIVYPVEIVAGAHGYTFVFGAVSRETESSGEGTQ